MKGLARIALSMTAALVVASFAVAGFTDAAFAEDSAYKLDVADKEPSADLKPAIKDALAAKSYTISGGDGPLFEFWFVKELPLKSKDDPRSILNQLPEITLLGVASVPEKDRATDFREDPIDPGLYTLRIAYQPQDGNHMGTAPLNVFAVLTPLDKDAQMDQIPDHDTLIDMSKEHTVAGHPPILYMEPAKEGEALFPGLIVGGEGDFVWQILTLQIPAKVAGGDGLDLKFHLVFHGHGDL